MNQIEVRGTPGHYECHTEAICQLPTRMKDGQFQSLFIIHGEKSWKVAKQYMPDLSSFQVEYSLYSGECTEQEIQKQTDKALIHGADMIIGIGGGKVLDIAKGVANKANIDVTLIPTLASTCAATTPLSVLYNHHGNFIGYTIFPRSTYLVLVDTRILLDSPVEYLRAGIGDTLAKWYEADVLIQQLHSPPVSVRLAWNVAKECKDVLLKHGKLAIESLRKGEISYSFQQVVETNLLTGGMVGGLGDEYGRIAGAHSIHNGLTQVSETHSFLHGEKVAYGILVQLAFEEKWDEINKLLPFYRSLQLPYSLQSLGITNEARAISTVAKAAALPHESIHHIRTASEEEIKDTMAQLEAYIA
ncbi:iron-containing alcohol dehydrogenase family protein [Salirhabdus salicampi]|uniref:iron-containing alcohol dehydrogenase family protein n=1 Tax=Salirhabdus salicampi TaxID=476102 RepID=UPI0020C3CDC0|nr:iron-containing alcohol dehydrogenase family protein [Salirhabdus salicampi]MCP8616209.1 iron-containing alcohol dehydrogenase family protein [Salirhabdus salicampi]